MRINKSHFKIYNLRISLRITLFQMIFDKPKLKSEHFPADCAKDNYFFHFFFEIE